MKIFSLKWKGSSHFYILFPVILCLFSAGNLFAAGKPGWSDPTIRADEKSEAAQWVAARFGDFQEESFVPQPGLYICANNDPVQRSSRHGKALNLNGEKKKQGLYVHAFSRIVVYSEEKLDRLTALLGVDSNEQTYGGRGSVVFVVKKIDLTGPPTRGILLGETPETELFRSPILREGMDPIPLNLDLQGATLFALEVEDAGNGIACDQADWADLKWTTQKTGKTIWADTLPFQSLVRKNISNAPPFSFQYGGVSSFELLPKWDLEKKNEIIDENRVQHRLCWTDPGTKLKVICEAVEYLDFPTIEWVVKFRNTGVENTPILSEIHSIDLQWDQRINTETLRHPLQSGNHGDFSTGLGLSPGQYVLHYHRGSAYCPEEFEPLEKFLKSGDQQSVATSGGRPTRTHIPYFNLQRKSEGGLIVVLGWPGQWAANFKNTDGGLHVIGGQERTHFTLYPGEEVRTPLNVIQFWAGADRVRSQNIWRRWMLKYNTPHPHGKLVQPHFAGCSSHQYNEMINATDETQIHMIDRYLAEGIPLDYWWMDAGWYIMKHTNTWPETGTWEVDRKRFPQGLRKVSDHAHSKSVDIIVWFEPERVYPGTWLAENHPEWILGGKQGGLLNLGNPDAWNWLVEHIDRIITEEHIDLYRQDFNMDPLTLWRANDAENRQGITEIKHVSGYLAYWDALLERHPGMLIDTCASGGNRLDLETLRRSISLLRSDYIFEPTGNQGQTLGLSLWIPIYGTGVLQSRGSAIFGGRTDFPEPYRSRSVLCPFMNSCTDVRVPADPANQEPGSADYENLRRLYEDWKILAPYFYGDFYPLTRYSLDPESWICWQFDLPEQDKGAIQVFRRPESMHDSARLKLFSLDPDAMYTVRDLDGEIREDFSGAELMNKGIRIEFPTDFGASILLYEKKK